MQFKDKSWQLQRYPKTTNNSLKAWSAADELLLSEAKELDGKKITLIHDSFGALATLLHQYNPTSVITYHSQLKAIRHNLKINSLDPKSLTYTNPFKMDQIESDLVLMKVPKSAELFELYLSKIHGSLNSHSTILCGFMTKYFTPRWLEIAEQFFDDVSQSKAAKKARVITLKSPKKEAPKIPLFNTIKNEFDLSLKQYAGVFSSSKIDIATQILLNNLPELNSNQNVLDLACGNGVIAAYVSKLLPETKVTALDDNFLAISSAKLNVTKDQAEFYWADSIKACKDQKFDLILCNPPFHFEYENNIEVALKLFREASDFLNEGGEFRIVANTHLNYRSHLNHLFSKVKQIIKSGKYEVISCIK
ncbi:MAG: methyltransferase [Bacteroidia bacterium]|nr:methyltransferase [Bacteroidia bacterium]NNJ55503.1 methyltransferase [Bacteroidia bacterium]